MSKRHLFSTSLFNTLFQHNLIACDGHVKASDEEILDFHKFLVQEAKSKTANLYKRRKKMVDEVCRLLKEDDISCEEMKKLVILLHHLNLKLTPDGTLENAEKKDRQPAYLGSSEPNKSVYDRQLVAEEKRFEKLGEELKKLDDFIEEKCKPVTKIHKFKPEDVKIDVRKFRARTERRHLEMEEARQRLISAYHADSTKNINRILANKDYPGRVHFRKDAASSTNVLKEPVKPLETAGSQFSDIFKIPHVISQRELNLVKRIFRPPPEEKILKVRKSRATEHLEVTSGVFKDVGTQVRFRGSEAVTQQVSEPLMGTFKDSFVSDLDKRYKSDSNLKLKQAEVAPSLDDAKQFLRALENEDKSCPVKNDGLVIRTKASFQKNQKKTVKNFVKLNRKIKNTTSSSGVKKSESSKSTDGKRASKKHSTERKGNKNRATYKQLSNENQKYSKDEEGYNGPNAENSESPTPENQKLSERENSESPTPEIQKHPESENSEYPTPENQNSESENTLYSTPEYHKNSESENSESANPESQNTEGEISETAATKNQISSEREDSKSPTPENQMRSENENSESPTQEKQMSLGNAEKPSLDRQLTLESEEKSRKSEEMKK